MYVSRYCLKVSLHTTYVVVRVLVSIISVIYILSHIKSRKLGYFGNVMKLPRDNTENSAM